MARAAGRQTGTQALAASAAIPFALGAGTLMQYVSFDYLAWIACSYFSFGCANRVSTVVARNGGCIGFGC